MHVSAQTDGAPVAGRHAGEVLARERAANRPAGLQPALARGACSGGRPRIAGELRVLLADESERSLVQDPPEGSQLRRQPRPGKRERRVRTPDEAPLGFVAEGRPSKEEPSQRAARQVAVLPAERAHRLGLDLVELPGRERCACLGRCAQLVSEAPSELDSPRQTRGRGKPQQLRELGQRARQSPRPGRDSEELLLVRAREAPALPVPAGREMEHGRVVAARRGYPRPECDACAVAADVDARRPRQPRAPRLREEPGQLFAVEVGEKENSRHRRRLGQWVSGRDRPRSAVGAARSVAARRCVYDLCVLADHCGQKPSVSRGEAILAHRQPASFGH